MGSKNKIIYRMIVVRLIIISFLPRYVYATEQEPAGVKRILIVDSYGNNNDNSWISDFWEIFFDKLEEISDTTLEVRNEYLNSIDHHEEEYYEKFREMLSSKYKNYETDLILIMGYSALTTMQKEILEEDSIFYHRPVLFEGVPVAYELDEKRKDYISGNLYDVGFPKLINLIMDLHQEVDKIKIIILNQDIERTVQAKAREHNIQEVYYGQVEIEFIEEKYAENILDNLRKEENPNYAILIGNTYYSNETKKRVEPKEMIERIQEVREVPIYTYEESYIMAGVIGGTIRSAEEAGENLAEKAKQILAGMPIPDISINTNQYVFDYKEVYENDINVNQIPKQTRIVNKGRFQLLLPRGVKWMIEAGVLVIATIGGCLLFWIYNHKQMAKKNKKLYEEAKIQEQIRMDFITGMSHDLKTPINIIRSSVALITSLEKEVESEYLDKRMKIITQNANRLLRLVNNLMDMIKLEESSYYKMKLENMNLVEVIEDICLGTVDYMNQRELEFVFDTEEEEIITAIDKEKIERVILNLLSNAIKFTPRYGKISVCIEKVDVRVRITIKDSGIGIESDNLDAIFLKFYQVDNTLTRPGEGSGIGLYIVKKLIELHKGRISVESKAGEGTRFVIVLPIEKVACGKAEEIELRSGFDQLIQVELSDV